MVIDGYLWLLMCISIVQWLSWLLVVTSGYLRLLVTLRNSFYKTMVIMVIDGYRWLVMVIDVYLNSAMVILVIVVTSGFSY